MESTFNLPIYINYRPPHWIFVLIALSHAGAASCLLPAGVPVWLKYPLLIAVCYSFGRYYRHYLSQRRQPPLLILNREDEWSLVRPGCGGQALRLRPGCFVHPRLVVISFGSEGRSGNDIFFLTDENTDGETLRRLRVRLRFPGGGE